MGEPLSSLEHRAEKAFHADQFRQFVMMLFANVSSGELAGFDAALHVFKTKW
jgi:hypothetical protein